jgi:hypothetical protein
MTTPPSRSPWRAKFAAIMLLAGPLLGAADAPAERSRDLTFSTKYAVGRPKTADFYLDGRAIGSGREAFAAIVKRIGGLPPGTSVVWGPDYRRCGSCSGSEPHCVPEFLYPDLWEKLEASVKERRLALSSEYPGPRPIPVGPREREAMPVPLPAGDAAAERRFDAVLDWEVGGLNDRDGFLIPGGGYLHRFSSEGATLGNYDLDLFYDRLPEGSRVLVRIALHKRIDSPVRRDSGSALAGPVRAVWEERIGEDLRRGKLKAVVTAPPRLAAALRSSPAPERLQIQWSNYHGPKTPHEEVLYRVDDRFVGRGDPGFANVLAAIDKLPPEAEVILPRYEYSGRGAIENYSPRQIDSKNARLRGLVPFAAGRREFDAAIARRGPKVTFEGEYPGKDSGTVMDWDSGDRYGRSFVSSGRIIHHDEPRGPAAARLAWTRYEIGKRGENRRQLESAATYTVDDVEVGRGVAGFAAAMERLAALSKGSVVQVRVCLRTSGPFLCPITYEGHRHFERTGFEPYVGLFPWLLDVANKHGLEIQWIPDEGRTCADCELNR